ncbi:winged-helix DNA-binding transcription factor family [Olea europaea subsp. europaea]|uniref:Winged-helix DNA-binding transcription factor family n=1 Tax=Olea europaea subsp. europaea TaxID=158383 RepID=A0A8S0RTP2_OLEEU|nr:winged-helix DNA-binding transcription factor family [Olea europaea subsp. europaea]
MIEDAIVTLKEKTGSSQYTITNFIEEKQNSWLLESWSTFAPVKKKTVPVSKPKAASLKTTKEKKHASSKANPKPVAKRTLARSVKPKIVKSPVKKVAAKKGKK